MARAKTKELDQEAVSKAEAAGRSATYADVRKGELLQTQFDVEESVGVELLKGLVLQLRRLQKPFESMSKREQDEVIDSLRKTVEEQVTHAVIRIAAVGRPTLAGTVETVAFKDGVKATIKFNQNDPNRHALADAQGDTVLVVVAAPEAATGGMDAVQGEEDQRAMELGHEYEDSE